MKWILLWLMALPALGFHKDFRIVNDRAPLEFKAVFDTLKSAAKNPEDQVRLVAYCERINKGLGGLDKAQILFLLKAETHKALLEWKFPDSKFNVGNHTVTRLRTTLDANQALYSPLSVWLIEALLGDLERYAKEGLLENNPRANLTEAKRVILGQYQRSLRYTRGWIEMADTLSAADFNLLSLKLGWMVMERVQRKSQLLNRLTTQAVANTQEMTFNIPDIRPVKPRSPIAEGTPVPTANETAQQLKSEAGDALENIEVKPSEIPAEDLSGAIDQIDAGSEKPSTPSPLE